MNKFQEAIAPQSIAQIHRSEKRASQRSSQNQQLPLFNAVAATPTQPLYVKPRDASYHGREGYFFTLHCAYGNGQFGGLYSRLECDRILELLKPYSGLISPREFGIAADRAIAESTGRRASV